MSRERKSDPDASVGESLHEYIVSLSGSWCMSARNAYAARFVVCIQTPWILVWGE